MCVRILIVTGAVVVDQLTPAVYVLNRGSSSIGPAIRIIHNNGTEASVICGSITVSLTPGLSRTYDQCLWQCEDERLRESGLLTSAIDLISIEVRTLL